MEQDEEKRESPAEAAGREIGRYAGRQIGSKIGAGAGGAAAGAGAGTAAGTAGGVAAGTGAGAASGAAAGSVVPGLGTAVGAVAGATVGAVVGRFAKYIILTIVTAAVAVVFFFLFFLVVIILVVLGLAGGRESAAGAPGPTGSGLGLKDNYCQSYLSQEDYDGDGVNDCSQQLKALIIKAAAAAKMPAGVLNAIGLNEDLGGVMVLSDEEILAYSQPGAALPSTLCTTSGAGAIGPMQFMPATFEGHKNFIIEVGERPEGYNPSPCNIEDSLYAAAHKLKSDSGIPFDELRVDWTVPEPDSTNYPYHGQSCPIDSPSGTPCSPDPNPVYTAAFYYLGRCVDPAYPDYYYCENVWEFYLNKKDETLPISTEISPPCGWPTTGRIETLFGEPTSVEPDGHSGIDIAANTSETVDNGQDVFNTMTGTVTQVSWTSVSGGRIAVVSNVGGKTYQVSYVHMSQEAVDVMAGRLNQTLSRGEAVGKTHPGSLPHSSGTHLHYEVYVNGSLVDPMDYTPARLNVGDIVESPGGCP